MISMLIPAAKWEKTLMAGKKDSQVRLQLAQLACELTCEPETLPDEGAPTAFLLLHFDPG